MNLKFLVPTLKSACQNALIASELNTVGPRAGFVLAFDTNSNPHVLYVEDAANSRKPTHITEGELLRVEVKNLADSVATLQLSLEQATERMVFSVLSNLSALLYNLKSSNSRLADLAGILNNYSVAGIISAIASNSSPEPSLTATGPERN